MKNNIYPITLIAVVTEKDELNQVVEVERITSTVIGEVGSVTQTEFFSGGRNGLNPSLKVVMYDFEYDGEPIIEWNNRRYSVYRTFMVPGTDKIELYLEEKGGTKDDTAGSDNTP